MSLSKSSLKICVLRFISQSFAPFKIGLRRKSIFEQVIYRTRLIHGPITRDEKQALNMRIQRLLNSLVQEGLIKRDNKGHQMTFYLLEKDAFSEYLEYLEEYADEKLLLEEKLYDKEVYNKIFRQKIINRSDYLKLPEYLDLIPFNDTFHYGILIPYEEFRSRIMNVVIEVFDPQIRVQYENMIGVFARAVLLADFLDIDLDPQIKAQYELMKENQDQMVKFLALAVRRSAV